MSQLQKTDMGQIANFGMFSDDGNQAVSDRLNEITDNGTPVRWETVMRSLNELRADFHEAADTAVRDAVFEFLASRKLLVDVKDVALHPERYDAPQV